MGGRYCKKTDVGVDVQMIEATVDYAGEAPSRARSDLGVGSCVRILFGQSHIHSLQSQNYSHMFCPKCLSEMQTLLRARWCFV